MAEVSEEVARLARMQPGTEFDFELNQVAERFKPHGIKKSGIAKDITCFRREFGGDEAEPLEDNLQGQALEWEEIEPREGDVSISALLDAIVDFLLAFLVQPKGCAEVIALWVLMSWAHPKLALAPYLVFSSAEKRSGKTTALEIVSLLCFRPLPSSASMSASCMFRMIERDQPSLLIDEYDTFLSKDNNPELCGMLNGGQRRQMARAFRNVGDKHEPRAFSTWCPKVLAGIGDLPDTVADRSIIIFLERKKAGEDVKRWRFIKGNKAAADLRSMLARFSEDHSDTIAQMIEEEAVTLPDELHDRAQDSWEPLLAVADLAGGSWPARARRAAKDLSAEQTGDTLGIMLLRDIRHVMEEDSLAQITCKHLRNKLIDLEEQPWAQYRRGNPVTTQQIAALLRKYKIPAASQFRNGAYREKGYKRAHFQDAWDRYLDGTEKQESGPLTGIHKVTRVQPNETAGFSGFSQGDKSNGVTLSPCRSPLGAGFFPNQRFQGPDDDDGDAEERAAIMAEEIDLTLPSFLDRRGNA